MQDDQSPDKGKARFRTWWIAILWLSLFLLALLWAVDTSIACLISAVAGFSLFKVFQLRPSTESEHTTSSGRTRSGRRYEESYEKYRPGAFSVFAEDVKQIFNKDSAASRTPQQSRVFIMLVAGFIGFIFFISIIGAFLGGEDSNNNFYQRAQEFYNAQQFDSAAYYYRLAIEVDPGNADLYYERGNAFLYAQKGDSALILYDQALEIDPTHQYAQYYKGYVYFDRRSYDLAIVELRKVISYVPNYTDALLLMGDSFYNQSQLDSALHWYEGAYATGFRSSTLCHLMGYIYDTKGNQDAAIDLYKEAIDRDTTIVAIYARLGELVQGEEGNYYREKAAAMK
jgi:tetratricopeptide (TPR) repeat protein